MSLHPLATARALDGQNLGAIKRRFIALNRDRYLRVQEALKPRQRDFLPLLPFLLHINHPLLPGYVSKRTSAGVSNYTPTTDTIALAQQHFKGLEYKRRALRQYPILGVYLMGSAGTIAYAEDSDFDIWVCHRPDLTATQREQLARKLDGIRDYATTLGLETHFFLMDVERFRRGELDALSHESCGDMQHHLLLEEFYRTALLVAGRYPLWWLVPPEHEQQYTLYAQRLLGQRFVRADECLDFGPLTPVPVAEFFGAALWQVYKGIGSPYKSLLKLLLLESYAQEGTAVELLAQRYKCALYAGGQDLDDLDPYLLMYRKVEEHLAARGEEARIELARRCLYFKAGVRLSQPQRLPTRRRMALAQLAHEWGWDATQLTLLDARAGWKIDRVLEERRQLVDELMQCYRRLAEFARGARNARSVDARDLTLLGRKLYAAFERKPGKVERINPGISANLVEDHLTLQREPAGDDETWRLWRGESDMQHGTALKRTRTLIELLVWCHVNRLVDPLTLLALAAPGSALTPWELRSVSDCLYDFCAAAPQGEPAMSALAQAAVAERALFIVNLGCDPFAKFSQRGMQLTSQRTDALSYGGQWENLAQRVDSVVLNSWQEVISTHYEGAEGLLDCLCEYLAYAPLDGEVELPLPRVYSFSSPRGAAIARRIEGLFQDVITCYRPAAPERARARYVLRIAHDFHLLQPENGVPRAQRIGDEAQLVRALGAAQDGFSPVAFDPHMVLHAPLPLLYRHNRPGVVQLFYQRIGAQCEIYLLDEHGALFHERHAEADAPALLGHYGRFLAAALRRRTLAAGAEPEPAIEASEILMAQDRRLVLAPRPQALETPARGYLELTVLAEYASGNQPRFTLYCGGHEFSALEHGDGLFAAVARHVVALRASGAGYPIYITDIELARSLTEHHGSGGVATTQLLHYKQRIERSLNEYLNLR